MDPGVIFRVEKVRQVVISAVLAAEALAVAVPEDRGKKIKHKVCLEYKVTQRT